MIELKDVSLGYNCRAVLEHISLKAAPGEILGLIGPNGSGKSTLIRGITRVIDLFSGHILVGGRSLKDIRREELARLVATVPQSASLPGAIAWQAMEATQTEYLAERRVGELSGGERQRIVIARALAQQPKVILLDEPTTYLDINHQVETLDLVRKICLEQNLTVIVALHDLNLASQYCDRLVILDEGKIFAEGIPMEVLTSGNVKEVYGAEISILSHPINGLPVALVTASRG